MTTADPGGGHQWLQWDGSRNGSDGSCTRTGISQVPGECLCVHGWRVCRGARMPGVSRQRNQREQKSKHKQHGLEKVDQMVPELAKINWWGAKWTLKLKRSVVPVLWHTREYMGWILFCSRWGSQHWLRDWSGLGWLDLAGSCSLGTCDVPETVFCCFMDLLF